MITSQQPHPLKQERNNKKKEFCVRNTRKLITNMSSRTNKWGLIITTNIYKLRSTIYKRMSKTIIFLSGGAIAPKNIYCENTCLVV